MNSKHSPSYSPPGSTLSASELLLALCCNYSGIRVPTSVSDYAMRG